MTVFTYKAINNKDNIIKATTTADSNQDVANQLTQKGYTPLSIQEAPEKKRSSESLPTIEKITLCRYIGTMLKSGLSISSTLAVLKEESTNSVTKKIIDDLSYNLEHGRSLSSVFEKYPNSFNKFFVTIVESGEVSGTLAETFSQLEKEVRAEHTLRQKILGALFYPAVVFLAMIGIGILMFFFILPQIGQVFLKLRLPLNPATITVFKATLILGQFKFIILGGLVAGFVSSIIFFRTQIGKRLTTNIISHLPMVKNLVKQTDIARFCRTFSTLLATGVPITQALEIALKSMSYPKFKKLSKPIINQVSSGKSLATAFKQTKIFPPLLTQMITSGEKSGSLDSSLRDLGKFYEQEVEATVKKATQILEPLLMLFVGIGVGVMVLSVIAPIYSVVSNLQAGN